MPLLPKPIQLLHHGLSVCRVQTFIKDGGDKKLWPREVEILFPLLQSSDDTWHLLPDLSEVLNLMQKGDWRIAIHQSLFTMKEDNRKW